MFKITFDTTISFFIFVIFIAIIMILLLAIPYVVFWTVDMLFSVDIKYTVKTILAFWLLVFIARILK